jgi:ribulose-phosphate 3-epimerase
VKRLHASISWADLPHLAERARSMVAAGADALHVDLTEIPHQPTLTRGPALVQALRHQALRPDGSRAATEVHLSWPPDPTLAAALAAAGADAVVFHAESARQAVPTLRLLRRAGCRAGIALHAGSSLDTLAGALGATDQVLMMVAASGATATTTALDIAVRRLALVRRLLDSAGGGIRLQAEGGIDAGNIARLCNAGVDDFIVGRALDQAHEPGQAMAALRAAIAPPPPAAPGRESGNAPAAYASAACWAAA